MRRGREDWENELWSYLSVGDGISCPLGNECELKNNSNIQCFNNKVEDYLSTLRKFIDDDGIDFTPNKLFDLNPRCIKSGRIFELVIKLANKQLTENWDHTLPISDNLILFDSNNFPIEVRHIPLKALHGAVWKLEDCWLIHLNSNDVSARRRFTLYHEIFHILAHCKATPVFKRSRDTAVYFNEMLADHFAANVLLPREVVAAQWAETKDVNRMASLFDVPRPVVYVALMVRGLI